jgi:hypothetical protein
VIGRKNLKTIRRELKCALRATGEDPIRWLEARLAALPQQEAAVPGQSEVLRSLCRFLKTAREERRRE